MSISDQVKQFFMDNEYLKSDDSLKGSDSLLENGIIDSVGMLSLVDFLENKYSIKIDEDDLMPENFDTLDAIEEYVGSKTN